MLRVKVSTDVGREISVNENPVLAAGQRIGFRDGKRKLITEIVTEIEIPETIEELGEDEWETPVEVRVEAGRKVTLPKACAMIADAMILDEHQRVQRSVEDGGVNWQEVVLKIMASLVPASPEWITAGGSLASAKSRKAFGEKWMSEHPEFKV